MRGSLVRRERSPSDMFFQWLEDTWESQRNNSLEAATLTYKCWSRDVLTEIFCSLPRAKYTTRDRCVLAGEWRGITVIVRLV